MGAVVLLVRDVIEIDEAKLIIEAHESVYWRAALDFYENVRDKVFSELDPITYGKLRSIERLIEAQEWGGLQ